MNKVSWLGMTLSHSPRMRRRAEQIQRHEEMLIKLCSVLGKTRQEVLDIAEELPIGLVSFYRYACLGSIDTAFRDYIAGKDKG